MDDNNINYSDDISFTNLPILWKILVILGGIFSVLFIGSVIVLILIFKTDVVPFEYLLNSKSDNEDLLEFNDFLDELDDIKKDDVKKDKKKDNKKKDKKKKIKNISKNDIKYNKPEKDNKEIIKV